MSDRQFPTDRTERQRGTDDAASGHGRRSVLARAGGLLGAGLATGSVVSRSATASADDEEYDLAHDFEFVDGTYDHIERDIGIINPQTVRINYDIEVRRPKDYTDIPKHEHVVQADFNIETPDGGMEHDYLDVVVDWKAGDYEDGGGPPKTIGSHATSYGVSVGADNDKTVNVALSASSTVTQSSLDIDNYSKPREDHFEREFNFSGDLKKQNHNLQITAPGDITRAWSGDVACELKFDYQVDAASIWPRTIEDSFEYVID